MIKINLLPRPARPETLTRLHAASSASKKLLIWHMQQHIDALYDVIKAQTALLELAKIEFPDNMPS